MTMHGGVQVHASRLCRPVSSVWHGCGMGCWACEAGADLDAVDQGRIGGFPALAQVVGDLLALGEDARAPERRQPLEQGVAAQLQSHRPSSAQGLPQDCQRLRSLTPPWLSGRHPGPPECAHKASAG